MRFVGIIIWFLVLPKSTVFGLFWLLLMIFHSFLDKSLEEYNILMGFIGFDWIFVGLYLLVRLGVAILLRFGAWASLVLLRNGWIFYVFQIQGWSNWNANSCINNRVKQLIVRWNAFVSCVFWCMCFFTEILSNFTQISSSSVPMK